MNEIKLSDTKGPLGFNVLKNPARYICTYRYIYIYILLWPDYDHFFTLTSSQICTLTDKSLQMYQIVLTGEQLRHSYPPFYLFCTGNLWTFLANSFTFFSLSLSCPQGLSTTSAKEKSLQAATLVNTNHKHDLLIKEEALQLTALCSVQSTSITCVL